MPETRDTSQVIFRHPSEVHYGVPTVSQPAQSLGTDICDRSICFNKLTIQAAENNLLARNTKFTAHPRCLDNGAANRIRILTTSPSSSIWTLNEDFTMEAVSNPPLVGPGTGQGHQRSETFKEQRFQSQSDDGMHRGLGPWWEKRVFYILTGPSWILEIAAGIYGSVFDSAHAIFIALVAAFYALNLAAWLQTAAGMIQRASWTRDESNLPARRHFLYLAVRLNRLMFVSIPMALRLCASPINALVQPTAVFALPFFIVAYCRRKETDDLGTWLIFLLIFICNTVGCVMNAYNNITWESDRLEYEEGSSPYSNTLFAILGYPNPNAKKGKQWHDE